MASGRIQYITLLDSGQLYGDSAPSVIISRPTSPIRHSAATSIIDSYGQVSGFTITDSGSHYINIPSVTITGTIDSSNKLALATAVLSSTDSDRLSNIIINNGGKFYTGVPTVSFSLPSSANKNALATATISSNKVSGIAVTDVGKFYTSVPSVTISSPSDTGKLALASAAINTGRVSAITMALAGKFYTSVPSVTISTPDSGDSGASATAIVDSNFSISGIILTDSGQGYYTVPSVSIGIPLGTADSHRATATSLLDSFHQVSIINLTDSGNGYDAIPTVTISSSSGTADSHKALGTAVILRNRLYAINLTDSGHGYTSTPTVTISAPTGLPSAFTASASAIMDSDDSNNSVGSINIIDSGNFYASAPLVTLDSSTGTAANFQATAVSGIFGGEVFILAITNRGKYYAFDSAAVPPLVTIASPGTIIFTKGETISHKLPTTTLRGEVSNYRADSGVLSLIHVGADDGLYHQFAVQTDSDIVGSSGVKCGIKSFVENNKISNNEQNDIFEAASTNVDLNFLDFSETNPFGDPGDE